MNALIIREARQSLSHPEKMFADPYGVLAVYLGKLVTRILPAQPKMRVRSLAAFRANQPMQPIPSEELIREDRAARD